MLNDVILVDKLPDFNTTLQFQAKHSASESHTSAAYASTTHDPKANAPAVTKDLV